MPKKLGGKMSACEGAQGGKGVILRRKNVKSFNLLC
jgi:hypothetical protein